MVLQVLARALEKKQKKSQLYPKKDNNGTNITVQVIDNPMFTFEGQ
jgi:hypothetical protein